MQFIETKNYEFILSIAIVIVVMIIVIQKIHQIQKN